MVASAILSILSLIVSLGLLLPAVGASIRRMHDINRSGWWILVGLIPILGAIVLIYWFVQKGTAGPNQYGEDPLRT